MWISNDGRVNTIRVDPKNYLSKRVRKHIDKLSDIEKVRLDLEMSEYCEEVLSTIEDGRTSDDETAYVNMELPLELGIDVDPRLSNFSSSIRMLIAQTPPRWRIERANLLPQYVTDYGPKFKTWSKLVDKIRSAE